MSRHRWLGMTVHLDGPSAHTARTAEVLAHFGARPATEEDAPDLTLAWAEGEAPRSSGRPTARHLDLTATRAGDELVVEGPVASCRLRPDGSGRGCVAIGAELPLHFVTYVLVNQLRLRGWYTVHAGAVARPGSEAGPGCLLVGESGAGKSTLALSLARQGWRLLSDDSVLLRREPAGPIAQALRRGVFLDPASAASTFPSLAGRWRPVPLVEASKHGLAPDVLPAEVFAERCVPRAVVFPRRRAADDSVLEPLPPSETLFGLVQQSRLAELDRDGAAAHLALLGELAGGAAGYVLHAGRDVLDRPDRVSALLQERVS